MIEKLHGIKAMFFDRGNVTHNCMIGPSDEVREQEIARSIASIINNATGQGVTDMDISRTLLQPWKSGFSSRSRNNRESQLEPYIKNMIESLGIGEQEVVVTDIINELGNSFIQWDIINPEWTALLSRINRTGLKIGIIANTVVPDHIYKKQYESNGVSQFIDCYVLSYSRGYRKPDPRIIQTGCMMLDISIDECALVGDKLNVDIKCARAAGAKSIWYNPNDDQAECIEMADVEIKNLMEIETILAI
jgi:FMN phosphatase YigB (HAD superfamily)